MLKKFRNPDCFWCIVMSLVFGMIWCYASEASAGEFEFDLSTSLAERYEDNYDLEPKGLEDDDFITSIGPALSLSYMSPTTELSLLYNPLFEIYAQNSDEDEIRQNGNLNLTSQLTRRLHLTITDTLSFTPGEAYATEEQFEDRRRRSRSYASDVQSNSFNSMLSYQLFEPTFIRGGFTYRFDDYDKSEEVDSDEYSFNLGIDHQLTGQDTVFANYQYRILEYDQGSIVRLGAQNDADVQDMSVGETHQFPRDLVLTVSGGVSLVDEDNKGKTTDWITQVILAKGFRTGSITASFDRSVSPYSGSGGTTVDNTFNITALKDFTRHLHGSLSAYYAREDSTSGNQVDDEDWGAILGTNYEFSRKLTGTFSGSFIRQNSRGGRLGGDTDNYRGRLYIDYHLRPSWSVFSSYSYYQQNALDPIEEDIETNVFEVGTRVTWF